MGSGEWHTCGTFRGTIPLWVREGWPWAGDPFCVVPELALPQARPHAGACLDERARTPGHLFTVQGCHVSGQLDICLTPQIITTPTAPDGCLSPEPLSTV